MNVKNILKKIWYFIWEEDSIASWIVNVILAFVLVKFIIYPLIGFLLATTHPLVAVVSGSMEHEGSFDGWWAKQNDWYEKNGFSKDDIKKWDFPNGFNRGDIMILYGEKPEDIKIGDVIVFRSNQPDPIIHRVVGKWNNDGYHFQTKGDHNQDSIRILGENDIKDDKVIGKAVFRIPALGWVKIIFTEIIRLFIR